MSNETPPRSSEAGESRAPVYTTTFVVDLGEHPGGLRYRSGYSGRGIVEVCESGLVVRYLPRRSALSVAMLSLLIWFNLHLVLTIALSSALQRFVCSVSMCDLLLPVLIGIVVIAFTDRQPVDIHVDRSSCTAHYVHQGGFVVVETPDGEWVNMTPLPANKARFLADVRKCFGDRFVPDSQVVFSMGMVQLASPPARDRSAIFGYIRDILATQTDLPEQEVTVNSPLAAGPTGAGLDMPALLEALKADYDADLTQADQEGLMTVMDLVDVVYEKLHPAGLSPQRADGS